MNYFNNLMETAGNKVKDVAMDIAINTTYQKELNKINEAKKGTLEQIIDTDERPFETIEISPEEQKEYDIKSYQAEQRILKEAAEKGLPPPTFGRPTPGPGEEPSDAKLMTAFGKRKIKKLVKKLKKIVKKRRKKKIVKKIRKKKIVKKRRKKKIVKKIRKKKIVKRKKKALNLKKVATNAISNVAEQFNKIKDNIQDIVKIGKKKRSFGSSATLPPMDKRVYNVKGYDPHALLMKSFFGKNSGCKRIHGNVRTVSPRDPMYKPQKKLSYGKRKSKRRVKKRKSTHRVKKRKSKRKIKKRKSTRKIKKRKFGKKVSKRPSATLRRMCNRLKVRLTTKRNGKRVYKSEKVLKKQCKNVMKRKK